MKTAKRQCWRCDKEFEATVEDYAAFPSECPVCLKRIADRDREMFRIKQMAKQSYRLEEVEAVIAKITPATFKKTNLQELPDMVAYRKVIDWKVGPRGLLLLGASGLGKTRCLWGLAHRLLKEGRQVEFLRETDFSHQVAKRGHLGSLWDWVDFLCSTEVLILDDLGKAPRTDRFVSELFHVIDTRLNEERPILISTQLEGEEIAGQITRGIHEGGHTAGALVRRLRDACEVVQFSRVKS